MKNKINSITSNNEQLFRKEILNELKDYKFDNIVDLGAWDGFATKPIADLVEAKSIICVDSNNKALLGAQKKGYQTIKADLNQKIDLQSNIADLVIVNQVIEHIAKTDVIVSETFRILKKGGLGLFCTPNLSSWHNIGALILGYQPFSSQVSDQYFLGNPLHPQYKQKILEDQAHLRLFTKKSLAELCSVHGFEQVLFKGVGYYPLSGLAAKVLASFDPIHSAYLLYLGRKV